MRRFIPLLAVAAVGLAVSAQAAVPLISARGAGPIQVGMTFDAARRFVTFPLGDGDSPAGCMQYAVRGYPELRFMVQANRVTRVTVYGPGLATPEGIEVGDRESKVRSAYGSRLRGYRPPWGEGHALSVMQTESTGLLFWIDYRGRVAAIHAGGESIRYEEGCL